MTRTVIELTATHWWSVLGWTIWAFFWIGLAEFLLGLPLYALLRRRSPELHYNILLAWMFLLCITPLYLLVHISRTLPVAPAPLTIALTPPRTTITIPQPERIRTESPDSLPNIIPPDEPVDSKPTLLVPDQTTSRIPNTISPAPSTPAPQIQVTPRTALPTVLLLPTQSENLWLTRLIPWLPGLWFLGATLSSFLIGLGLVGAERFRRQARILTTGPLFERCTQLAAQLHIRGKILIGLCDRIATPILLGIWRPLILLPITAETGWPPDQLDMILLHELAHVRRFDNFVHLLQRLAEGLLFFQPAIWILSHWISQEREHCCDSLVVRTTGRPHDYARTLAHIALGEPFPTNLAPASALAQSHVLTRIRRILNQEQSLQVSRGTLAIVSSCLLAALLIVGALNARETPNTLAQNDPAKQSPVPAENLKAEPKPADPVAKPGFKTITARVVDGRGQPVHDVTVNLSYFEKTTSPEKAVVHLTRDLPPLTTDSRGRFTFEADLLRIYDVKIKPPTGFIAPEHNGTLISSADKVPDFVIKRPAKIRARVLGLDGKPLPGAPFSLTTNSTFGNAHFTIANAHQAVSDEKGQLQFNNIPPGTAILYYPWGGGIPARMSESDLARSSPPLKNPQDLPVKDRFWYRTLNLADGETRDVEINFIACNAAIRGRLVDADSNPIPNRFVRLSASIDVPSRGSTSIVAQGYHGGKTDADGRYEITGLLPADYDVQAVDENGVPVSALLPVSLTSANTVTRWLHALPQPQTEFAKLPILTAEFSELDRRDRLIRIVDEKGNPLPNAQITFEKWQPGSSPAEPRQCFSRTGHSADANGILKLTPDFAFEGELRVQKEGYLTEANLPFQLRNEGLRIPTGFTHDWKITLRKYSRAFINVKNHSTSVAPGRPFSAVCSWLGADQILHTTTVHAMSDADGRVTFDRVPPGSVQLVYPWLGEEGYTESELSPISRDHWKRLYLNTEGELKTAHWAKSFNIEPGQAKEFYLNLSDCTHSISGIVRDSDKKPRPNTPVSLQCVVTENDDGRTTTIKMLNPEKKATAAGDSTTSNPNRSEPANRQSLLGPRTELLRTITDVHGNWSFSGLAPGSYQVLVHLDDSAIINNVTVPEPAANDKTGIQIDLPPNYRLSTDTSPVVKKLLLTVRDTFGNPLPDALVMVQQPGDKNTPVRSYALTDSHGNAEVSDIKPGPVSLLYPVTSLIPSQGDAQKEQFRKRVDDFLRNKFPSQFKSLEYHTPVKDRLWFSNFNIGLDRITRHEIKLADCNAFLDLAFMDEKRLALSATPFTITPVIGKETPGIPSPLRENRVRITLLTDQIGHLRIGKIPPGRYLITWFDNTPDRAGSDIVGVSPNQHHARILYVDSKAGNVTWSYMDPNKTTPDPRPDSLLKPEPQLSKSDTLHESNPKKLHLTILGPDKQPLPGALLGVTFKSTERSLVLTHYAVSNPMSEMSFIFPDEGVVNLVYPVWLGSDKSQLDPSNPQAAKFERDLRRVIGSEFKSLAAHFPVKNILYTRTFVLDRQELTRFTVDLSECRSPVTYRFVDENGQPFKPSLQLSPASMQFRQPVANKFEISDFFYPLSLGVGDDGVLNLGKMNPGPFLLHCDVGQESHGIPLLIKQETSQDLIVKVRQKSQVEVTSATSGPNPESSPAQPPQDPVYRTRKSDPTSDRFPRQPPQQPLKISVLGPDQKPLPDALLRIDYQAPHKPQRTEFALSNQQGQLELKFPEKGQVSIFYPLHSEIPASEDYRNEGKHISLEHNMKRLMGSKFKSLEQHVPVKEVIWMSSHEFQANGEDHATVDLSRCKSEVQLEFVNEQGRAVVPTHLEWNRFADNLPPTPPNSPSPLSKYAFRMTADQQGRIALGKMNPGKYEVTWSIKSPNIRGGETLLVEEGKKLTRKIVLRPLLQAEENVTTSPLPSSAPASTPELRYEGKTFNEWRDQLRNEISTDTLAKGINVIGIFALRGYRDQSVQLIISLLDAIPPDMNQWGQPYDPVFENAGKSLRKAGSTADDVMLPWLKSENATKRVIALHVLRSQFSNDKNLPEKILADLRPLHNDTSIFIRGLVLPLLMKQPRVAKTAFCRACFADKNQGIREQAFHKLTGHPEDFDSPIELLVLYHEQYPWEKPTHDSPSDLNFRNEYPQRLTTFVSDVTNRRDPAHNSQFNQKPGWFYPLYLLLLSEYFSSPPNSELETNTHSLLMFLFGQYPQVLDLDKQDPLEKFQTLAQSPTLSPEKKSQADSVYKILKQFHEKYQTQKPKK